MKVNKVEQLSKVWARNQEYAIEAKLHVSLHVGNTLAENFNIIIEQVRNTC